MGETIERIEDCLSGRHYALPVLYRGIRPGFIPQSPTAKINILYQEPSGINVHLGQTPNGQLALTAPDTAGTSKFNAETADQALDEIREEDKTAEKLRLLDLDAARDRRKDKLMQEKILAADKEREIRDRHRREKDEIRQDFLRGRARSKERNRRAADEERNRKEDERRREREDERKKWELESQERQAKREREKPGPQSNIQELLLLIAEPPPRRLDSKAQRWIFMLPLDSIAQMLQELPSSVRLGGVRCYAIIQTRIKVKLERKSSVDRMREVNLAKDVLLDEKRRQAYDERGITTLEGFREWQSKRQYVRK
ncbi:hypothetical protein BKA63DRAFT_578302 [Paraphoma chrysanthemicola]|nr:hypothetical protein BKA63DRAFT_578302 [Paraphoma chrysanthemicola]